LVLLAVACLAEERWDAHFQAGLEHYRAGRFAEARTEMRRAADLADGPQQTAQSWNNLAAVEYARGDYPSAETAYRKALQAWEALGQGQDGEYAKTLGNLASLYRLIGQLEEAEAMAREAATLVPDNAAILLNLAETHRAQGKRTEAALEVQRVLKLAAAAGDDLMRAHSLQVLALLEYERGWASEAEPPQREVVTLFARILPAKHPLQASAASNMGQVLAALGRLDEARTYLEKSLDIWKEALGPEHPNVAAAMNNLAQWHMRRGEAAAAEPLLRGAVAIWERAYGPDHPDVAKGLYNLGAMLHAQGRLERAEELYRRALAASDATLGPTHEQTVAVLKSMVELYALQHRDADVKRARVRLGLLP
jgi:tetratricopeptide (TPR) repeat protein